MSDGKEFLKEAKEVRNEFVKIAGQYSVSEHLELRTEIDTLLIMYDQACERVRVGSKPETSASTCNLQNVSIALSGFMDWLWLNHNILTNADNNKIALEKYLATL